MKKIFCASMMCANYGNLQKEIEDLKNSGIDSLHLDVMDGSYVPNFGMGLQDIEYICKNSTLPCDGHLMISDPDKYIDLFTDLGCKALSFHPETVNSPARTLQSIKNHNLKAGIVVNPNIAFETVSELLYLCDYVLIMTVNPGFSGQAFLDFTVSKIKKFVNRKVDYKDYLVLVDGACSKEVIANLSKIGVDGFVLGTSALFQQKASYKEIVSKLKDLK